MHDDELEVCTECSGTGEVPELFFDNDSKEWIQDGMTKCVCRLKIQDNE